MEAAGGEDLLGSSRVTGNGRKRNAEWKEVCWGHGSPISGRSYNTLILALVYV